MSDGLFDILVGRLLKVEGGYTNNPSDKGGETNFGITVAVARENGYAKPMKAMTRDDAVAIYRAKYWAKPGVYLIAPISEKIAEELFDTGVNMGTGTAGTMLQRVLNALNRQGQDYPDVLVDGAVGGNTATALAALAKKRGPKFESVVLKGMNCLQGARYIELSENRSQNEDFTWGWLDNRVSL